MLLFNADLSTSIGPGYLIYTSIAQADERQKLKLYNTNTGALLEHENHWYSLDLPWDDLITRDDLEQFLAASINGLPAAHPVSRDAVRAPIGNQEVWGAGVTYARSREARMGESESSGGGDFYDRVYHAERPELFFKATPHRVVGSGGKVTIRSDAKWSVPEPELALLISPSGKILGYTIGNDMSSRDIEGENPLYLPQAKVYNRCCALGPCILVMSDPLPRSTEIRLDILREAKTAFAGTTTLNSLKRDPATLVKYLYRDNSFPYGCFLLTDTGIIPPDSFTLAHGDEIHIAVSNIGTLVNLVG
jgi:2-dehydro-3-deoxy-D-arabinonate dehydratase